MALPGFNWDSTRIVAATDYTMSQEQQHSIPTIIVLYNMVVVIYK